MSDCKVAFEKMWSGEHGDFVARCDFYREKLQYHVTVFHVPSLRNLTEYFDMTCFTPPISTYMDMGDCKISEAVAENLSIQLEKEVSDE